MPDPTHINPHVLFYIRGDTHALPEATPPVKSTAQEFRRELDLGCYSAETLDEFLNELVAFTTEWVANHPPLGD